MGKRRGGGNENYSEIYEGIQKEGEGGRKKRRDNETNLHGLTLKGGDGEEERARAQLQAPWKMELRGPFFFIALVSLLITGHSKDIKL